MVILLTAGCGGGNSNGDEPETSSSSGRTWTDPRAELTARVALAKDRHYLATYVWRSSRPDRTVTVLMAADGTWRVDVPGGALGGTADVSIVWTAAGYFQCVLSGGPQQCVRVASLTGAVPRDADPQVQHLFTDYLDVLLDRKAPLSIDEGKPPKGASGDCFSVESNSVVLDAPLPVGTYCFAADGVPTAASVHFGTVVLTGDVMAPAPTAQLPAEVVDGGDMASTKKPVEPKPSGSSGASTPSGRPSPSKSRG